jgi:hypothetical protein
MLKNLDFKTTLFHLLVVAGAGFLSAFSKQYVATSDLATAWHVGYLAFIQFAVAGLGLDQVVQRFTATTNVTTSDTATTTTTTKV